MRTIDENIKNENKNFAENLESETQKEIDFTQNYLVVRHLSMTSYRS